MLLKNVALTGSGAYYNKEVSDMRHKEIRAMLFGLLQLLLFFNLGSTTAIISIINIKSNTIESIAHTYVKPVHTFKEAYLGLINGATESFTQNVTINGGKYIGQLGTKHVAAVVSPFSGPADDIFSIGEIFDIF